MSHRLLSAASPSRWSARQRVLALCALPAVAALAFFVHGADGVPPNIPPVALASEPLYAATTGDKPALTLALSVEYPTVGAQYVAGPSQNTDGSYDPALEYLGYYDTEACYAYNNAPTERPQAGSTLADYKRFDRRGAAAARRCDDAFSGNFLNWASNSAIDMLRLALSGGDRYIDEAGLTIMQRAVIPNGDPVCMWNSLNFPAKQLKRNGGGASRYWGAVPKAMIAGANGSDIWVANTLDRIYFGTAREGSCNATGTYRLGATATASAPALNSDGFFYARVKVCDQDAAGELLDKRDYAFCTRYPNGTFKPTGTIQRYADSLRLAAFGYALEQTPSRSNGVDGRYGGVLRAPMKYVGAKTFDVYGQLNTPAGGNPAAEWDAATGVFKPNPDADTTFGVSGVVNYLNKFGRTGVKGLYKRYDPVGELYYEALRYLQGLPPSPAAISELSTAMHDGFPIHKDWTALDPYADRPATGNYACLKSNIVVIGDVNTHDGGFARLMPPSSTGNVPDFRAWTQVVGAFERGTSMAYKDGAGTDRTSSNPNAVNASPPGQQLVGEAYWAHTHDIRGRNWTDQPAKQRPGLRVKTFTFDVNEYGWESDTAQRRQHNQFFTAAKYGGFETAPNSAGTSPYNPYGNPFQNADGATNNDIWQDPARPGEARAYYLQSSARGVLAAFDSIFQRASDAARSIAGTAAQSDDLTPGTSNLVYEGTFDTKDWSGDLLAKAVTVSQAGNVSTSAIPAWSASARLAARTDLAQTRNIVVGNPGATSAAAATPFLDGAIGAALAADLNRPDPASAPDNLGAERLKYIRGDRSKEGTLFRPRDGKLLGDVVNSGAVYSGAPSMTVNSASYAAFRKAYMARTPAVFVGANDGMLHAFNAATGDELFGYIPSWMGPKLSALTSKTYLNDHQSYVDATPAVAEAQVGAAGTAADWKTILVGGTGAGGRGVFALDVTDPASFSAAKVLWEFTPDDDPDRDMGFVVGRPQILKFRTSQPGATPTYKWFAVVASGVNNYVPDSARRYGTGRPAIYLLDLAKQAGTPWQLGSNYHKVSFPFDGTLAAVKATGMLDFSVSLGAAQEVTRLFAGDLHGNMWKLDFSDAGSAGWTLGGLSPFKRGTAPDALPYPLYIAKDAAGNAQPITSRPALLRGGTPDAVIVAFGTGKYLEPADRSSTAANSFYAIYDDGSPTADASTPLSVVSGRARLQAGVFDAASGRVGTSSFVWGRPLMDSDTSERAGWYLDYPATGERLVSAVKANGAMLDFGTMIPDTTATASICGVSGGGGRNYTINVDTGVGESRVSTVGLLGESLVLNMAANTVWTETDSTGRRLRKTYTRTFNQGSRGIEAGAVVEHVEIAGRLSWRQVHNYLDLRSQ